MVTKTSSADLRAQSRKTFEAGLIISLSLAIAAFKFFPGVKAVQPIQTIEPGPLIEVITPPTEQPRFTPPPPQQPVVVEVPPDVIVPDFTLNTELVPDSKVPPPPPPPDPEDIWFEAVESPPKPIDGFTALQSMVKYPDLARRAGLEGTVVVMAFVEKDGRVSKTEILKGIGLGCDEEAANAVKKTRFIPGKQREKPVRVKVAVPIKFRLSY